MAGREENIRKIEELIALVNEEIKGSRGDKAITEPLSELSKGLRSVQTMMLSEAESIAKEGNRVFESIKAAQEEKIRKIQELKERVAECKEIIGERELKFSDDAERKMYLDAKKEFDRRTKDIDELSEIIKRLGDKKRNGTITPEELKRLSDDVMRKNEMVSERGDAVSNMLPGSKDDKRAYYQEFLNESFETKNMYGAIGHMGEEWLGTQREITEATKQTNEALKETNETAKAVRKVFSDIKNLAKSCANEWLKYDDIASKQGRQWGLNNEGIARYRKSLMDMTYEMADRYGVLKDDVAKIQDDYAKATGRVMMLTKDQTETMVAAGKLMSQEAINTAVSTMDEFGSSAERTNLALGDTHEKAAALGLNAAKTSEAFAKNMRLASSHTFSKGVDGIQRMTLLAQRLKFDMNNIAASARKFEDISGAIETSANLQMLGGSYAMGFGNPVEAMYDAMNDMESFTKRVTDMWGGKGVFNEKTGMVEIGAYDKRMIRESAKAIGYSEEEALRIAQRKSVEERINSEIARSRFSDITETQRTALISRAQWDDEAKRHYVTYQDKDTGETKKEYIENVNRDVIEKVMGSSSVEDINQNVYNISGDLKAIRNRLLERAKGTVSLQENLNGIPESGGAGKAQAAETAMNYAKKETKKTVDGKNGIWSTLYENLLKPNTVLGVLGASATIGVITYGFNILKNGVIMGISGAISRPIARLRRTLNNVGNRIVNAIRSTGGAGGSGGGNWSIKNAKNWIKANPMKAGLGIAGAAASIGGAVLSHYGDKRRDEGDYSSTQQAMSIGGRALEFGGMGAGIGGMIGGPIGAAIGGAIGGAGGAIYGIYEDRQAKKGLVDNSIAGGDYNPGSENAKASGVSQESVNGVNDRLSSIGSSVGNIERAITGNGKSDGIAKGKASSRQTNINMVNERFDEQMKSATSIINRNMGDTVMTNRAGDVNIATVTPAPIVNTPNAVTPSVQATGEGKVTVDDININVNGTLKLDVGGQKVDFDIAEKLRNDKVLLEKVVSIITGEFEKRKRYGSA